MTQPFTASEVRNEASNHWRLSDGPQQTLAGKMLHAYADRLEADEKAMPGELDFYDAGLLNDFGGGNVIWWWDYMRDELGRAHSFYQSQVNDMMLVAHSAQAQPTAASVPGELDEPLEGVLNYEQELSFADGWNACRKAMLATQEESQNE